MKKVFQSSILRAVVAIVVGALLVIYRRATLHWMIVVVGALFFVSGCVSCLAYSIGKKKALRAAQMIDEEGKVVRPSVPSFPIAGVGSALLGLVLVFMTNSFINSVAYVLAAILILGSISQFVNLGGARRYARIPLFYWLLPAVTLTVGVLVVLKPMEVLASPLLVIGWCMMFYGVVEALNALKIYQLQRQFRKAEEAIVVMGTPAEEAEE